MTTRRRNVEINTLPSPFPEGWYFIASRRALEKARHIEKTWMGEDIVVWRDDEGNVSVADAYCPHLGAYLGPSAGGCVQAGRLVCPFHGYEFDTTGQCVATPFADPPKTAKLRVYPTQEVSGLIFAWWGIGGREPRWDLHPDPPEADGWCAPNIQTLRFPGHPQETTENSVDLAHLRYVHDYDNVDRVAPMYAEGPYCWSDFDFKSVRKVAKFASVTMDVSARAFISGLGYSLVNIRERSIGMDLRMWVLATPVDGNDIDLSLVSQVREIRGPKRFVAGLGFLPVGMRAPIMNKIISLTQRHDVMQDIVIWQRKRYRSLPRLCRSDGEIMPFRYYCSQFYPAPDEDADSSLIPARRGGDASRATRRQAARG